METTHISLSVSQKLDSVAADFRRQSKLAGTVVANITCRLRVNNKIQIKNIEETKAVFCLKI